MDYSFLFYIAQFSYFLTLASFAIRNVAGLRALAMLSSCGVIYYSFNAAATPLWISILWNVLFIIVNAGHLVAFRWRSRDVKLDALEEFLAKTVLTNFPPAEVRSFVALAAEGTLQAGAKMIQIDTEIHHLYCVVQGKVDIVVRDQKVAELGPGRFVGEMSLLTRANTRADVLAATNVKLLVWPHENIEKWVDSDSARLGFLQTALGTQVVEELLRQQIHGYADSATGSEAKEAA